MIRREADLIRERLAAAELLAIRLAKWISDPIIAESVPRDEVPALWALVDAALHLEGNINRTLEQAAASLPRDDR